MVLWRRKKTVVELNQYAITGNLWLRKEQKRSTSGSDQQEKNPVSCLQSAKNTKRKEEKKSSGGIIINTYGGAGGVEMGSTMILKLHPAHLRGLAKILIRGTRRNHASCESWGYGERTEQDAEIGHAVGSIARIVASVGCWFAAARARVDNNLK